MFPCSCTDWLGPITFCSQYLTIMSQVKPATHSAIMQNNVENALEPSLALVQAQCNTMKETVFHFSHPLPSHLRYLLAACIFINILYYFFALWPKL